MAPYLQGFTPYKKEDADKYNRLRWWAGLTYGDILDKAADIFPDKEALVDRETRFTYSQVQEKTHKLALGFIDLGIRPLDRVLVQLPNWAEFIFTFFALQKIGAIPIIDDNGKLMGIVTREDVLRVAARVLIKDEPSILPPDFDFSNASTLLEKKLSPDVLRVLHDLGQAARADSGVCIKLFAQIS